MADRRRTVTRWWVTRAGSREVLLLAAAYLAALASLLSYVSFNGGTGMPTRAQMALMLLPVAILYVLTLRSSEG